MLCMALALTFAGASAASAVDGIQHSSPSSASHEHLPFTLVAVDGVDQHGDHHEADHEDSDEDEGTAPTDQHRGHHHHADSGSGLLVLAAHDAKRIGRAIDRQGEPPRSLKLGLAPRGPERPPKPYRFDA
jgi:hypothetical protein